LDYNELKKCCVKFHSIFSPSNLSYFDVDDLFSELRIVQFVLSTETMSTIDNELKECCAKFHSIFSPDNLSDLDVEDLFS
jgi:hypothetical protein